MPLSLIISVCAAMPGYEVPHCDIRAMRVIPQAPGSVIAFNQSACTKTAQAKADTIADNALRDNPGSKVSAMGVCFDRDLYAEKVMQVNQYMIDHGYTSDFTAY